MNQCVKYKWGKIRKDCAGLDFRMCVAVGRINQVTALTESVPVIKENWNGRFFVTEKVTVINEVTLRRGFLYP